jgi:hypothetical protein
MSPTKAPDSRMVVILFAAGAGLVIASFTYALVRRWPIVGVGLLLIVIYERLGHMHTELRTIAYQLELMNTESKDGVRGRAEGIKQSAGASKGASDAR